VRSTRSTQREPGTMPQILHDLTWNRTKASGVGSRLLTARSSGYQVSMDVYASSECLPYACNKGEAAAV
jgi:hypothetical protein